MLLCLPTWAQRYEIGAGFGSFLYSGELARYYNLQNASPGGMVIGKLNLNSASVLRVNLGVGSLRGNAAHSSDRVISDLNGSSFSTMVAELSSLYEYNFFDYRKYKGQFRGTPFLTGGLTVFYFQPQAVEPNGNVSPIQFGIPFGIGYKYALTRNWNIGAEATFRYVFTPYLDNTADFIPRDPRTQQLNPNGDAPNRGYKYFNDWYMFGGVTLTYTFYSVQCPFPDYW